MPITKARSYVFTINNPDDSDRACVEALSAEARYYCCAPERGDQGTPHLQGYVVFNNQRSFRSVARLLPRAHVEPAHACALDNRTYIFGPYEKNGKSKPENPDAWEFGDLPRQGSRGDIDEVKEAVMQGTGMRGVLSVAKGYQSAKFGELLLKHQEPARSWKPTVKWFWGPTGTGKSKTAFEELEQLTPGGVYVAMSSFKWWEGYDAHESVLIDDMRGDFAKFHELLRLLDRYPLRVETKGGSRQFLARTVIITSCKSPRDLYLGKTDEDIGQLTRRIDEIRHFSDSVFNPVIDLETVMAAINSD